MDVNIGRLTALTHHTQQQTEPDSFVMGSPSVNWEKVNAPDVPAGLVQGHKKNSHYCQRVGQEILIFGTPQAPPSRESNLGGKRRRSIPVRSEIGPYLSGNWRGV